MGSGLPLVWFGRLPLTLHQMQIESNEILTQALYTTFATLDHLHSSPSYIYQRNHQHDDHHTNHYDHTEYHCHTDQLIIPSHEYDDHNYQSHPGYFCRHDHLDHHHDQYHIMSSSSWPVSYDLGNFHFHDDGQVIILPMKTMIIDQGYHGLCHHDHDHLDHHHINHMIWVIFMMIILRWSSPPMKASWRPSSSPLQVCCEDKHNQTRQQ